MRLFNCLLLAGVSSVFAEQIPTQRINEYCDYLVDRIYCYGGYSSSTTEDFYYLPVQNRQPLSVTSLSSAWVSAPVNKGKVDFQFRKSFQRISTSDHTKMLMQGGFNYGTVPLQDSFIEYDAITDTWASLPDYEGPGHGQIYKGSMCYVSSLDKYIFFGGISQHTGTQALVVDGVQYPSKSISHGNGHDIGFTHLASFDMKTLSWNTITTAVNQDPSVFSYQSSIYSSVQDTAYYFGGYYLDPKLQHQFVSFKEIHSVQFPSYTWTKYSCTGDIPSNRAEHTTTLLADGKTVLLYGGLPLAGEYCHLLDLDTRVWKKCGLDDSAIAYPNRYGHSAVLVQDKLFILFGYVIGTSQNDVLVLDVSDLNHIKFNHDYTYTGPEKPTVANIPVNTTMSNIHPVVSSAGNNNTKNDLGNTEDSSQLDPTSDSSTSNTSTIIGVTCSIIGLAFVSAGIFFFIRRKRQSAVPVTSRNSMWTNKQELQFNSQYNSTTFTGNNAQNQPNNY
ncbi:hypothetical protein BDB01DRAFT_853928 [Pilobolus umbonatus]|nr:hypothetical protein BDB01DRAFT_853928 [Pilobolus umbonatus]